jgi:hypothetical protein
MGLQDWANVATIIGSISIPLSGLFIWLQIRQQTRLAKVANTQSLVELSSPLNLQLIQDRNMAEYWIHGAQKYETYDDVEKYRYKSLLIWWLILHENIYFQWSQGLVDDTIYRSWQLDLQHFLSKQCPMERWSELRNAFQPEFAKEVESLFQKPNSAQIVTRRSAATGLTAKP